MTPGEALDVVVQWGFVLMIAAGFLAFAISFIRDAFKD